MSSSSSNNVGDDAWLMKMELRRDDAEEVTMEEDGGDSLEVHLPTSKRDTLAGISTSPNPHQAMRLMNNPKNQEVQEELPFPLGDPCTGYIGTIFIIWFTIMGLKILLVYTYRPIGTYLLQEKVMQEQILGGRRINILWPRWKRILS
jgi:hypothetical protein